jgi:dihydrofolate reductase
MRKVIYGGAMSLDGFIAGPNGEYDWIVMDPDVDFATLMGRFDTFLIGRKTFEVMRRMGDAAPPAPGIRNIVFSRTLRPEDCPQATLSDDAEQVVADLRAKPGKDIALFGGGELFRSLLAAALVDELHFNVVPVLLGGGIPLLPSPADRARLKLKKHRVYEKTGTVGLEYDILPNRCSPGWRGSSTSVSSGSRKAQPPRNICLSTARVPDGRCL